MNRVIPYFVASMCLEYWDIKLYLRGENNSGSIENTCYLKTEEYKIIINPLQRYSVTVVFFSYEDTTMRIVQHKLIQVIIFMSLICNLVENMLLQVFVYQILLVFLS